MVELFRKEYDLVEYEVERENSNRTCFVEEASNGKLPLTN